MRVSAVHPTITPDGRVTTALLIDGAAAVFTPYRREHICWQHREVDHLGELTLAAVDPLQACPMCGAALHLTADAAYCCHTACAPRRADILLQQLALLGVTLPVERTLELRALVAHNPTVDLLYFFTEHAPQYADTTWLRDRVRQLSGPDYLRLLGVPAVYGECFDDVAHLTPHQLWAAALHHGVVPAFTDAGFSQAVLLALVHVNRAPAQRLAELTLGR